jgi:hypothetical protein
LSYVHHSVLSSISELRDAGLRKKRAGLPRCTDIVRKLLCKRKQELVAASNIYTLLIDYIQ